MQNLQDLSHLRRAVDPVPELHGFDTVTGLASRELFLSRAEAQWERYQRDHRPLGFVAIDLDRLTEFTKHHGQEAADDALGRVGTVISDGCRRRADLAGRLRHGELGVLLSEVDEAGALGIAEELRRRIEELRLGEGSGRILTASIGVACMTPPPNRFVSTILIAADRAVQNSKSNGRNRIELYCAN